MVLTRVPCGTPFIENIAFLIAVAVRPPLVMAEYCCSAADATVKITEYCRRTNSHFIKIYGQKDFATTEGIFTIT